MQPQWLIEQDTKERHRSERPECTQARNTFAAYPPKRAASSYSKFSGHKNAAALSVVQRRLLEAVARYMTAQRADMDGLALRHLSAVYGLLEVKRDLRFGRGA